MGNHRADHRALRRRSAPRAATPESYVGKRIAGRETPVQREAAPVQRTATIQALRPDQPVELTRPVETHIEPEPLHVAAVVPARMPTVELPALHDIALFDPATDSSTSDLKAALPGKRRAVKHAGPRGSLVRGLPSLPVAVGVATLAIAAGGVVTSADTQLTAGSERLTAPNAMSGSFGTASVGARSESVSRDSDRDALAQASGTSIVAEAERNAAERNSALNALRNDAEKEAAEIALNRWVLPLDGYRLTATYGQYGLWASYHTGLDFAAPSGTPLRAIANGVVTEVGSDGAYGNKTVLTLEDGTELWYCHQSSYNVQEGDTVRAGDVIGYVGSTGNVTGPHLHLEVRPGGGDPVDPDAALRVHGVTP